MSGLVFDERLSRQIESMYSARDFRRRRELVHELLRAEPGERILDVGCGPGFYVAELLERVGQDGSVIGVDSSPQMLELAARRCAGVANVTFREGPATALPLEDASVDAALSVQVMEYVGAVDLALEELHRVVRPGGRVVIWDVDWSTVSWHSDAPDRMDEMLREFDAHLAHPTLPRTLAARLRAAGFEDVTAEGHAFTAIELTPDAYGAAILPLIEDFVAHRDLPGAEEAHAWAAEQRELDERGRFFFACIQFGFAVRRS